MNWQPISTAPQDDRIVIASDGAVFGAAKRWVYTEPQTIGFNSPKVYGFGENTERPNPLAGQQCVYYSAVAGWTVWDAETEWEDGDHSDRVPKLMTATHWCELPERPI